MRWGLLAGLIWFVSVPVLAQDMPRYDVAAYCKAVAGYGGNHSEMLEEACFDQEQEAYDSLKPEWAELASKMRDYCDQVATFGSEGSYLLLEACIDQEMQSAGVNRKRKFKY